MYEYTYIEAFLDSSNLIGLKVSRPLMSECITTPSGERLTIKKLFSWTIMHALGALRLRLRVLFNFYSFCGYSYIHITLNFRQPSTVHGCLIIQDRAKWHKITLPVKLVALQGLIECLQSLCIGISEK